MFQVNTHQKGTIITESDPKGFGDVGIDISMIDNISLAPTRNLDASPTRNVDPRAMDSVDYHKIIKQNAKAAMSRLKALSSGRIELNASLIKILADKTIYDVSNYVLPRVFKRKLLDKGSEIKIGSTKGTVKRELGRGAYGVVVLLEIDDSGCSETIAIKAQPNTECLAHEFEMLKKIECRIGPKCSHNDHQGDPFPFPKPMSFVTLADGGLMSMTAASESGLNLVDLVNAYQEQGWKIDDLVALHYMARMLHHLELLHWHGKILHCDVKPDNWVLCASNECKGSDLMLVDFGRAVDLSELATDRIETMNVTLFGDAAERDMMCVSMRKHRPWSFDADTFGLCASVHVLLFGTHIDIVQDGSKRWMPRQSFKRYWQRDIWKELFDTLLNSDEGTMIGSRPRTLRLLRKTVEERLESQSQKVDDLLQQQEQILWATRPQHTKRKR